MEEVALIFSPAEFRFKSTTKYTFTLNLPLLKKSASEITEGGWALAKVLRLPLHNCTYTQTLNRAHKHVQACSNVNTLTTRSTPRIRFSRLHAAHSFLHESNQYSNGYGNILTELLEHKHTTADTKFCTRKHFTYSRARYVSLRM